MHPLNPYRDRYDLKRLAQYHSSLESHIVLNPKGEDTIDFNSANAVYDLNKAILMADFGIKEYHLPNGYLIPPIPGRLDYLLHLHDFMVEKFNYIIQDRLYGLDIGAGANGIYSILAAQYFNWNMVGAESDSNAVAIAQANLQYTKDLLTKVEIRHQENKTFLFKNIIQPKERFDFTVCNPPFHSSKEDALKGSLRKLKNLGERISEKSINLNFKGQANELWCNGGETLFIKRMIKESKNYKDQVKVFSSLVSKADNLPKIEKQFKKAHAMYQIIPLSHGNKKIRIIFWWY